LLYRSQRISLRSSDGLTVTSSTRKAFFCAKALPENQIISAKTKPWQDRWQAFISVPLPASSRLFSLETFES
jgi:hypothetical protein